MTISGLELARLWSEAPAFLPHGAGCACVGHTGIHLEPAAVEADVLDYLDQRYAADGERELAEFLTARRRSRGVTFASWLIGLDTGPLSDAARARLLADLDTTISSFARSRA